MHQCGDDHWQASETPSAEKMEMQKKRSAPVEGGGSGLSILEPGLCLTDIAYGELLKARKRSGGCSKML
jgi:hypothetical protein